MRVSDNHITYEIHPDVCAGTIGRDAALPWPVLQMNQVHDVQVAVVDRPDITPDELDGFDALVTNLAGLAIGVRTADCIPIILYDPVRKSAAAVHSGWRGTVAKILRNAIGLRVAPKRNLESCCANPCRAQAVKSVPIYIG